jgi:hypothetical protein
MTSVTFPPALGGDGSTVTDDSNATTGLGNSGHRARFVPALVQTVAMANSALNNATTAQAAAATATAAPGTNATSTTSLSIGTGAKTLTVQTGKSIVPGMQVLIANTASPATQFMRGTVTGYVTGTGVLDVAVDYVFGSGTIATWTVSLTGAMDQSRASSMPIVVVSTTTQTAVKDTHYVLTNVAATTVTLPASPASGDTVWVTWANSLTTNVIARNAQTIMGSATDLTLNTPSGGNGAVQLRFVNSSWRLL